MIGPLKKVENPKTMFAMLIVMVVCALAAFYKGYTEYRLSGASEPSRCTVLKNGVFVSYGEDNSPQYYHPEVTLSHEVGGKRYERTDVGPQEYQDMDARRVAHQYRTNSEVDCTYLNGHPELVRVFPVSRYALLVWSCFGLFLLLLVPIMYVFAIRRYRKAGSRRKRKR